MNSWITQALLGLIAVSLLAILIQGYSGGSEEESPAWNIACGGGLCVALDAQGHSYWGLREEGSTAGRVFHWYVAGNVRESKPFGLAACRDRIASYQRERASLQEKLARAADPAPGAGADAMENAQKRMLARIARLDLEKLLNRLESEQGPSAEECRKLLELAR